MRIAIVGSGISGLVSAYLLGREHDITVYEANDYIGGHTNTVDVDLDGEQLAVDTGFIVYNDWTYPNFIKLLSELDVASQATTMSFSVRCDQSGLEYNGTSLNAMFAQRSNLLRPRFYGFLREIMRFNRESLRILDETTEDTTVDEYLTDHGFTQEFCHKYLIPMGAAIWSCPPETFGQFPIRFVVDFYKNHGLLSVTNRPTWRVIQGGSQVYVGKLTQGFRDRIRLNCPVRSVSRTDEGVTVRVDGEESSFDEVVFACHSDQALAMLEQPTDVERELLGAFPYQENVAVLHTDISVLPRRRLAWASWNYHRPEEDVANATVTYNMNILQGLQSKNVYCVTLNEEELIDSQKVLARFVYHHPIYTTGRQAAQQRHSEVIRNNRTSFCGAYWKNGFHEDGVNSALAVCRAYGIGEIGNRKPETGSPSHA
ncbi:MAG: FAD-dependent oxidoreductase [Planctomycetaceae bacterium]|nr:FAD-dependent oxidoreductase [Planctomycetaceae bacterium]